MRRALAPLLLEPVSELPEYRAAAERLEIPDREIKNHIRCVALGNARDLYLYTVVDEAWCIGVDSEPRWGLRMPTGEEWIRCSDRTERVGTSAEVNQARHVMALALPVTPEEITQRYKQLAMKWHPDLNTAPDALARMQELNLSVELLTGADLSELDRDAKDGNYALNARKQ